MRKTAILLFFATILSIAATMVACQKEIENKVSGVSSTETVASETEDPRLIPPQPTDKYKGQTYRIANGYYDATKYVTTEIFPEMQTGDVLIDALYKRCIDTEERLGINIEVAEIGLTQIKNNVAAGDDFTELTFVDLTNVMSIVTQNACYDFYDIPNIALEKAWWDQNAEQKLSFENHLFYTFNDTIFTQTDNARAVYFNKQLATDLNIGNLYTLVNEGGWTIDKIREYGIMSVSDLNGDGKFNSNDRYGIMSWGVTGLGEALLTGCEAEIMQQGEDGVPYFYCFTERFSDIYTKIMDILTKDNLCNYNDPVNMFENDRTLFMVHSINNTVALRDMETDFGILPNPKLDEAQEKYWNVSPNAHAMIVPVTVQDLEFAGTVMEEMAYQSHQTLLPAYYEILIKGKTTRDEESIEMLDIIHNGISYVIKIIGTQFSDAIYTQMQKGDYNITSFLASWRERVETQLQEVLEQFKD